jgi:hypothetical protein
MTTLTAYEIERQVRRIAPGASRISKAPIFPLPSLTPPCLSPPICRRASRRISNAWRSLVSHKYATFASCITFVSCSPMLTLNPSLAPLQTITDISAAATSAKVKARQQRVARKAVAAAVAAPRGSSRRSARVEGQPAPAYDERFLHRTDLDSKPKQSRDRRLLQGMHPVFESCL